MTKTAEELIRHIALHGSPGYAPFAATLIAQALVASGLGTVLQVGAVRYVELTPEAREAVWLEQIKLKLKG